MSVRLTPTGDKGIDRNMREIEDAINAIPAQGVVSKRWRFTQSADGAGLTLEYFDGKKWTVKATW